MIQVINRVRSMRVFISDEEIIKVLMADGVEGWQIMFAIKGAKVVDGE